MADALRRSLVVLIVLGLLAGGAVWWLSRRPANIAVPTFPPAIAREKSRTNATLLGAPRLKFTDITREAGIGFRHVNGARGDKFLPETMGGGVAFFDCDQDGDQDLLFVNSTEWPTQKRDAATSPGSSRPTLALYENDGKGHFRDVTQESGLAVSIYGMGVACGDFDNDGWVDLYFTAVGGGHLFRNLGHGKFTEVTSTTPVGGSSSDWSTAAAWIDIDNDGDLDLYVGQYVQWTPDLDREVNNQLVGVGRAYGRPWNFPGTFPRLYRNEGKGRFTDVTGSSGLQVKNPATGLPMAKSLAVAPIDLNEDGWIDLVVANDTVQNFVFTNRHDGTFREVGAQSGIAFDAYGQARGAMGIDAARFRNDDVLGIAIGNFANEMNALYVSQGEQLVFADEAISAGIGPASQSQLKFGLFFFDYDLDGRLDVLTVNGHIEEEIEKVQPEARYRQSAQLFWNAGGHPTFVAVGEEHVGPDLFQPIVGRGSAYADIDGDGDLDVVMTQVNGPPVLLRNEQALGRSWIRVRLEGVKSNRDAIGAWITVVAGNHSFARQVMPTRSYLSQSELPVTIGLGNNREIQEVRVVWPSGKTSRLKKPPTNQLVTIRESDTN